MQSTLSELLQKGSAITEEQHENVLEHKMNAGPSCSMPPPADSGKTSSSKAFMLPAAAVGGKSVQHENWSVSCNTRDSLHAMTDSMQKMTEQVSADNRLTAMNSMMPMMVMQLQMQMQMQMQ